MPHDTIEPENPAGDTDCADAYPERRHLKTELTQLLDQPGATHIYLHGPRDIGEDVVTLNAEYTDTGKDFDLLVEWNNHDYWIDVRTPDGALGELRKKGGGWITGDSTGSSITNKLEKQFKPARAKLPDNAILVLAVYLQATALDQLLIGKHLHERNQQDNLKHPGHYCDAFLEYTHHHGQITIDVRELTTHGKHVTQLRNKLLEG